MGDTDARYLGASAPPWRRLIEVLAKRQMGSTAGSEIVAWAEGALATELDSPSLRILAGLAIPPNEFEVDHYVNAVAAEAGIALPRGPDLLAARALHVAEDLVAGRVATRIGAQRLYELARATGSIPDLSVWSGLDDALAMADSGTFGTVGDVEAEIIAQARRLLDSGRSR